MNPDLTIGAAIPAYRDSTRLRRCLESLAEKAPALFARTVVVDDSGDGRVCNTLRPDFQHILWIVHTENRGFGVSATEAVSSCRASIVVLLNDDVQLLNDPSLHLQTAFEDPELFAVTFQSRLLDGTFREGAKRLVWPMGMPRILHNERDQFPPRNGVSPSSYAVGGHAAYHREKFVALGGFDALYEPFYWEDVDLCERARQRGWRTTYRPDCLVTHGEDSAIRTANSEAQIREITLRNRLLFAWRHLPAHLKPLHAISLAYHIALSLLSRDRTFLHAFAAARERWRCFHSPQESPLIASHTEGARFGKE